MHEDDAILVGKGETPVRLLLSLANRHGLIAGATGTGKTVTLQTLAEGFSGAGVPVFLVDVKGDLSGLALPGNPAGKIAERIRDLELSGHVPSSYPVVFWDVLGSEGHPVRTTVSDMGPVLLARLLDLNDTQSSVLHTAFAIADDEGLLLLDLKDLRAILSFVSDNAGALQGTYGNIAATTVGAIQRKLLVLEREGGAGYFGEPALSLTDLLALAADGRGLIHILAASALINKPRLYATFLLWLLSELFEQLPEIGDPPKPKLVLFFDEAHLLFKDAPKALLDTVEQVVRLIRSKGIGIYFITQSPTDLPEDVLGQLANRVQHALRAFTAKDHKAVKAAAATFRANPAFATEAAITALGVGEALVSMLQADGTPAIVQRARIAPPRSRVGPATAEERRLVRAASPIGPRYDRPIDRESAYEHLKRRAETAAIDVGAPAPRPASRSGRAPQTVTDALVKSAARAIGSQLGREGGRLVRGLLGSLLRGR